MDCNERKERSYYIKRTHKITGDVVHIGPSDCGTLRERVKEYRSVKNSEYDYELIEFVYSPML